jgi:hypothetical protein
LAPPVSSGQPDSFFIAEVRRSLRDQAVWVQESPAADGQSGAYGSPVSKPIRLQRSPIARTNAFLSAPQGVNQLGFISYVPLFDPPPPIFNPTVVPVVVDGGAGTMPQGPYQLIYTYVIGGVEQGMSPPSNVIQLQANHRIQLSALTGLPTTVVAINVYLIFSPNLQVGFLGQVAVTAGVTIATTFNIPGNGILPALIITDTGELFFPLAPSSGTVSVSYQSARFSDQQVLDALNEGMDLLWPEVWTPQPFDTTSVLPSPVQWEYALPAAYADPRCVIQEVETDPPSAFVTYRRISAWRFINDSTTPTLIFERPPPTGGTVRLTYTLPYTSLSQVPSIAQMLPVYYAIARLLSDQEVMRSRADDLPALTGENAGAEKGGSLQTAAWWMQNMYMPALKKLSLGHPARRSVAYRAVERLNLGPIWQSAL